MRTFQFEDKNPHLNILQESEIEETQSLETPLE